MKYRNHIIVILACLLTVNVSRAAEPLSPETQYGAYPVSFQPENIEKKMIALCGKYEGKKSPAFSAFSKELMADALGEAAKITGNDYFKSLGARVSAMPVALAETALNELQAEQYGFFKTLINLPDDKSGDMRLPLTRNTKHQRPMREMADNKKAECDYAGMGLYLYNVGWGINRPVGMLWLYAFRLQAMRTSMSLMERIDRKGRIDGHASSLGDAAVLAGLAQMYAMSDQMSHKTSYTSTGRYLKDIKTQKQSIESTPEASREQIVELMSGVAQAQMSRCFNGKADDAMDADRSWYRGAFFAGISSAWKSTGDEWYLQRAVELSNRTRWEPGPNAMHDGNDLAISQTYLELCLNKVEGARWRPTQIYLDSLIACYNPNHIEWSWCDALFMSPPTWARMSTLTGDRKYLDHMDQLWWEAYDIIYDRDEHLFYRDRTTAPQSDGFQLRERNGRKIFWGRGNGWVMGGICRVMEYMPQDYPARPKYETLYRDMCSALLSRQGSDGLWRVSLNDAESYPMGETSGSTFICYAFAWGVNNGLLDKETYGKAALKSWHGLAGCVLPESQALGYVQLPADSPLSPTYRTSNVEYAAGAFLLAGSEILKLID